MSLIKRMRKQLAVLWTRNAQPDGYGEYAFAHPVQIKCRWDDMFSEVVGRDGQLTASSATVYVDRPVQVGDKLKKGAMDTDTPDDPRNDRLAFEVKATESYPNLRAKEYLLVAKL